MTESMSTARAGAATSVETVPSPRATACIDVILPVKDMPAAARTCLELLSAQLGPHDRVVVVDDGSAVPLVIEPPLRGVQVLRRPESGGPYAARHEAALRSTAEFLVFVDARCRPLPGLLEAHRSLLRREGTGLSATEVLTRSDVGDTLATRVAELQQMFTCKGKVGRGDGRDFFPTANLGVRAGAYRAVGGFRRMRSGADADLCWRIQDAGLGSLAADERVFMTWQPRVRFRELMEQWHRYGLSTAALEQLHPHGPSVPTVAPGTSRLASLARVLREMARDPRGIPTRLGLLATQAGFQAGYWRVKARRHAPEAGWYETSPHA